MMQTKTDLPRITAAEAGVNPAAILQFVDEIEAARAGLHSMMLIRGGRVFAEGYWRPYRRCDHSHVFSLTKSFTSLGIGFMLQEGRLSLATPVGSYFATDFPDPAPERVARMTVRDLLTMQSGHSVDTMPAMFRAPRGGIARAFFAQELTHDPGTFFLYNNGASNILAKIIRRVTGETLETYLKRRLLDPLGIQPECWDCDSEGDNYGGWGLHLRTEDIARFGVFCLHRGRHQDRQLLNADYFRAAGSQQNAGPGLKPDSEWWPAYGYHFWVDSFGRCRADGSGGQLAMICHDLDAVLGFTASSHDIAAIFRLVHRFLIPALRGDFQSDREVSQAELEARLAALELPLPVTAAPRIKLPPVIEVELNQAPDGIPGKFRLAFKPGAVLLRLPEETIAFPFDHWSRRDGDTTGLAFLAPDAHLRVCWTGPRELSLLLYRDPIHCRMQFKLGDKTVSFSAVDRQTRRREGIWRPAQ